MALPRALIAGAAALGIACGQPRAPGACTIAAATSLRAVLPALDAAFRAREGGPAIALTFGSSGALRMQVEGGAPVDGVIFASAAPVDALIAAGQAGAASRRVLATNALVLIGPRGGPPLTFATLGRLPAGEHLAIGDPASVPAGQYARDLLVAQGLWDPLQARLVLGGDVAAVLAYARRGEVAAAIVYRTEVRGVGDVVLLDEARGPGAPTPEVVAATIGRGPAAARAGRFLEFVRSPAGQAILRDHGFGPPQE